MPVSERALPDLFQPALLSNVSLRRSGAEQFVCFSLIVSNRRHCQVGVLETLRIVLVFGSLWFGPCQSLRGYPCLIVFRRWGVFAELSEHSSTQTLRSYCRSCALIHLTALLPQPIVS